MRAAVAFGLMAILAGCASPDGAPAATRTSLAPSSPADEINATETSAPPPLPIPREKIAPPASIEFSVLAAEPRVLVLELAEPVDRYMYGFEPTPGGAGPSMGMLVFQEETSALWPAGACQPFPPGFQPSFFVNDGAYRFIGGSPVTEALLPAANYLLYVATDADGTFWLDFGSALPEAGSPRREAAAAATSTGATFHEGEGKTAGSAGGRDEFELALPSAQGGLLFASFLAGSTAQVGNHYVETQLALSDGGPCAQNESRGQCVCLGGVEVLLGTGVEANVTYQWTGTAEATAAAEPQPSGRAVFFGWPPVVAPPGASE